jgi:hypothetical protein
MVRLIKDRQSCLWVQLRLDRKIFGVAAFLCWETVTIVEFGEHGVKRLACVLRTGVVLVLIGMNISSE